MEKNSKLEAAQTLPVELNTYMIFWILAYI